jgi:hypothetical protein
MKPEADKTDEPASEKKPKKSVDKRAERAKQFLKVFAVVEDSGTPMLSHLPRTNRPE